MSAVETYRNTYGQIKKRVTEYNLRHGFVVLVSFISILAFVFSILPLIPLVIALYFKFDVVYVWLFCTTIFFLAFWLSNRLINKINVKYGITLEEKMFLPAYESLRFLEEYLNPTHPIKSSRTKAGRKLERINDLLNSSVWQLPNISIVREEAEQLSAFQVSVKKRLIPAIEKALPERDKDLNALEISRSALQKLVEYLAQPQFSGLKKLNEQMQILEEITEKGIIVDITRGISRPSNLKYFLVLFSGPILAVVAYYTDLDFFGAKPSEAFQVGLEVLIGAIAIYAAYFIAIRISKPKS